MKTVIIEMQNSLVGLNSRLYTAEERINEQRLGDITQVITEKRKRWKKGRNMDYVEFK